MRLFTQLGGGWGSNIPDDLPSCGICLLLVSHHFISSLICFITKGLASKRECSSRKSPCVQAPAKPLIVSHFLRPPWSKQVTWSHQSQSGRELYKVMNTERLGTLGTKTVTFYCILTRFHFYTFQRNFFDVFTKFKVF